MIKKLIVSGLLLFLGGWFIQLWRLGQLDFYILPRFNALVVGSGALLCVCGLALLLWKKAWHEVQYHLESKSLLSFLVLVGLAVFLPARPLTSQSVAQRGVDTDLSQVRLTTTVDFSVDATNRTFADWVKIIGTSESIRQYAGEEVRIQGFVFRGEDLDENEFYLARFLIRCCSADARPVVIKVRADQASTFQNDQWLEVSGVLTFKESDETLFVQLDQAQDIPMPESPYIY